MATSAEEQLLSGHTWAEFCDVLKRSGQQILRPEAPSDALTRAEGFRYLSRLLRIALEMHVEFADPAFPGFFSPSHETAKIAPTTRTTSTAMRAWTATRNTGSAAGAAAWPT